MPPGLRQRRQAGEHRVNEDGEDQRPGAPEPVGQDAEHHAADGPADEEDREDDAAVPADGFGGDGTAAGCAQQIVQRGMQDERVDRGVHRVEHPAEPRDEQHEPLVARDAVTP